MEQGNKPCAPLRDDHYATIAKILAENRSIQVLDLSNQAGEQHNFGILPIFQALVRNNSLQELRLNHSGLPFHCGIHIRSMLENNGTLRRLDLANNQLFFKECVAGIIASLTQNFTLEELDISNTHLDYTALPGIAESLDNQQQVRKALDLQEVELGSRGLRRLMLGSLGLGVHDDRNVREKVKTFFLSLKDNKSLIHLNFTSIHPQYTGFSSEVESAIIKMLAENHTLQSIGPYGDLSEGIQKALARNISIAFEESWKVAQEFLAIHHLPADLNNKILELVNELNTIRSTQARK